MVWPTSDAWLPKVVAGFELARRVEVWSDTGRHIGNLPVTDGSVKDDWVSGVRRSVALSVPPTPEVRVMLLPGVELKVFSGVGYGYGQPELLPHGWFPVTDTSVSEVGTTISLNVTDRWQWVARYDFLVPTATTVGATIQSQIAQFIADTNRWRLSDVQQLATSQARVVTSQVFDTSQGGRATAIHDLAASIGAEVFINRTGFPVIRDRMALGSTRGSFRAGNGGRLRGNPAPSVALSDVDVYNSVRVSSTNTDPAFKQADYVASITDLKHPAYPRRGIYRQFPFSSAQYSTPAQMKAAAEKLLTKVSRRARQVTFTATAPDASLDASDTVAVNLPSVGVDQRFQIQSISHPLSAGGTQDFTLVSTRTDEDFTP